MLILLFVLFASAADPTQEQLDRLRGLIENAHSSEQKVEMQYRLFLIQLEWAGRAESPELWAQRMDQAHNTLLELEKAAQYVDEAQWFYATELMRGGQEEAGLQVFRDLVRQYPESRYAPDVYMALGDYYWDANDAFRALTAYQRASVFVGYERASYATYKLSWCYYNLGEYSRAIAGMKTVIESAASPEILKEEARNGLIRFYADAGSLAEAQVYFGSDSGAVVGVSERLMGIYREQGKFLQAIETARWLIVQHPARRLEYQLLLVGDYVKLGKQDEVLSEVLVLADLWRGASLEDRQKTGGEVEGMIRKLAVSYYLETRKLGSGEAYKKGRAISEQLYRLYFQLFPNTPYSHEMHYSFGELLYSSKRFGEAYEEFVLAVAANPYGKHAEFCAESAIFAADQMLKLKSDGDVGGFSLEEVRLMGAIERFLLLYPESPKNKNLSYKLAYIYADHKMYQKMADCLVPVIERDPAAKEAVRAAVVIVNGFADMEDWDGLIGYARLFYRLEGLGDGVFKEQMQIAIRAARRAKRK